MRPMARARVVRRRCVCVRVSVWRVERTGAELLDERFKPITCFKFGIRNLATAQDPNHSCRGKKTRRGDESYDTRVGIATRATPARPPARPHTRARRHPTANAPLATPPRPPARRHAGPRAARAHPRRRPRAAHQSSPRHLLASRRRGPILRARQGRHRGLGAPADRRRRVAEFGEELRARGARGARFPPARTRHLHAAAARLTARAHAVRRASRARGGAPRRPRPARGVGRVPAPPRGDLHGL